MTDLLLDTIEIILTLKLIKYLTLLGINLIRAWWLTFHIYLGEVHHLLN